MAEIKHLKLDFHDAVAAGTQYLLDKNRPLVTAHLVRPSGAIDGTDFTHPDMAGFLAYMKQIMYDPDLTRRNYPNLWEDGMPNFASTAISSVFYCIVHEQGWECVQGEELIKLSPGQGSWYRYEYRPPQV